MEKEKRAYIKKILQSYPKICQKSMEKRTRNEQRRVERIHAVLDQVDHMQDAMSRRKIIDMVYFQQTHKLYGAALCIPVGKRTAERWNAQLIVLVEQEFDLP